MSESMKPLCVDLDGTLTRSDVLFESVCGLLKLNLFYVFLLPFWLLSGKAKMKQSIASRVDLDVRLLPWNKKFIEWLQEQKQHGRKLVLATASDQKYAKQIAEYFGIFDAVIASDGVTNASGQRKLKQLQELLQGEGFDYAGNAQVDIGIWKHAENAILVNPDAGVQAAAAKVSNVSKLFEDRGSQLKAFVRAIRVHQWLKNSLIFVPLILSYQFVNPQLVFQTVLAFIAFSVCASSVYLLNDLLDLESDRKHPTKHRRPFAAGDLSLLTGAFGVVGFTLVAFGMALLLPVGFMIALLAYYVLTLAYSAVLKRAALVDVLVLASLYTMRLIAGAAAIEVEATFWLLAFSMFTFLSLALIKRYSELLVQTSLGKERLAGRGYVEIDLESLSQMGAASGYLAVMVLALYIDSDQVKETFNLPQALWLLCPMMLYWVSRLWLLTRRGDMHDDPIVFTIQDRRTHWLAFVAAFCLWAAF
ncbi:MAG: UbiA family prenyltransferase [Gammaproteobacteria bacterium]|nr:UbiA family prenyltransferase [Gammaproteobacteria bacterium]